MNNFGKNLALWIIIGLLLVALFNLFQSSTDPRAAERRWPTPTSSTTSTAARSRDVTIQGNTITGHFTDGRAFTTYAPNDPEPGRAG